MPAARAALRQAGARRDVALMRTPVGDPAWRDLAQLRAAFGDLVDTAVETRLRAGGRVDSHLKGRWAIAHGFESETYPGTAEWRALRAFLEGDE